jgi:hypothetical protein
MQSWDEIMNNMSENNVDILDETMDEINLIRYYIIATIQIYVFQQLDEGNENILQTCYDKTDTTLENNDGTYLNAANTAMHSNEIIKLIKLLLQIKGSSIDNCRDLINEMFEDYRLKYDSIPN